MSEAGFSKHELSGWATFCLDLRASARAWRAAPGLPWLTACLLVIEYVLFALSNAADWLILPGTALVVLTVGFVGTQRIWYLRCFRGDQLEGWEAYALTRSFLGRFFVLGLLTSLAGTPIILLGFAAGGFDGAGIVAFVGWWLCMDFVLTFVTPALAYSTRSVKGAVRIGMQTIRLTWPMSKWYLLVPGLAFAAIGFTRSDSTVGSTVGATISIFAGMLALWFKGAIAALYLRYHPETGRVGAAYDDQLHAI